MIGLAPVPEGTLVDRAVGLLASGPAGSGALTRQVLGIPRASETVADRLVVALLGADPRVGRLGDGRWTLLTQPTGSPALADCAFAVVDVETTGGGPGAGDRITEIAVVAAGAAGTETLVQTLVNPGRPIPRAVTAVTRITNEMVRTRPAFAEVADQVLAALAGRVFVAHNVAFDWRFLAVELKRARGVVLEGPRVCTVRLARRLVPGLKSRGLDSLVQYFGIAIEQRHRAGPDARATAGVLQRLLSLAGDAGVGTLPELAGLCARRGPRGRRGRRAHPRSMDAL